MEQASIRINNDQLRKQLKRYLVTGVSAVSVDTIVYFLLLNVCLASLAKTISFLSGTFVAYLLNKFWTFENKSHSSFEIYKFAILYSSTLGLNILVNYVCLTYLNSIKPVAFLLATGSSTILNFIGQKWWVFKK